MISEAIHKARDLHSRPLVAAGVVAGVLGTNALLAVRGARSPMFALVFTGLLVLLALVLPNLGRGIVILMLAPAVIDFSIGTGTQSRINLAMLLTAFLVVVWVVRMLIIEKKVWLVPSPANLPLIAFALMALVSLLAGNAFWDWTVPRQSNILMVQFAAWALIALSVGAFLWSAAVLRTRRLLQVVVASGVVLSILAVGNAVLIQIGLLKTYFFLPGVNSINGMWMATLAYAQLLFNGELTKGQKLACVTAVVAWVYWGVVMISWVSGWLPLLVALLLLSHFRSKRALLLALVGLAIAAALGWGYLNQHLITDARVSGTLERPQIWRDTASIGLQQPLLGVGPANYSHYMSRYAPWQLWISHTNYIDIFNEMGIVGLGLFIWAVVALLVAMFRSRQKLRVGFDLAYLNGVIAGFGGILVGCIAGDWLIPFVYNIGFKGFPYTVYSWLMLGGATGLQYMYRCEATNILQ